MSDSTPTTAVSEEEQGFLAFFGLDRHPFPVAPDNEHFFISTHIDQILTEIIHGIVSRKGFMVLTGDVGLGKTTISRRILAVLDKKGVETSLVFHTAYQDVELLREINRDFGIDNPSLIIGDQMRALNEFLLAREAEGRNCAIIVDDAQNLDARSIELIRLISNLETDRKKLVQILLIGQPELMDKLSSPELRQVMSRIIIKAEARPLNLAELNGYLNFKLGAAGNRGQTTVVPAAVRRVYDYTSGNFRQVNILMDRCLYVAHLRGTRQIEPATVREAWADLPRAAYRTKPRSTGLGWPTLVALLALTAFLALSPQWTGQDEEMPSKTPTRIRTSSTAAPANTNQASTPSAPPSTAPASATPTRPLPPPGPTPVFQPGSTSAPGPAMPVAVAEFLKGYDLSRYEGLFFEALRRFRFETAAAVIAEETGWRLVQLAVVPDQARGRYGLLSYPAPDGTESWFLFWKPTLTLKTFYMQYQGPEIIQLQQLLANLGLYQRELDGIVGRNLMLALNEFQRRVGLTVTGFPDDRTIFLLCHQGGV